MGAAGTAVGAPRRLCDGNVVRLSEPRLAPAGDRTRSLEQRTASDLSVPGMVPCPAQTGGGLAAMEWLPPRPEIAVFRTSRGPHVCPMRKTKCVLLQLAVVLAGEDAAGSLRVVVRRSLHQTRAGQVPGAVERAPRPLGLGRRVALAAAGVRALPGAAPAPSRELDRGPAPKSCCFS